MARKAVKRLTFPWPVPYKPSVPKDRRVGVGIIGAGVIVRNAHLPAYRDMGLNVVAICDTDAGNAQRAAELAGGVDWYTDYRQVLDRQDVHVVDAATHPSPRIRIMRDALKAGKDVLSQKPFVHDLTVGRELVALAKKTKRLLAVNQNGRWAPSWKAAYELIVAGAIGTVQTVRHHCHREHNKIVVGQSFDRIKHLMLYDFAIHWFDITTCWLADFKPLRVYASHMKGPGQRARQRLLAQAAVEYDHALASFAFDGNCSHDRPHEFCIEGTNGAIISEGEQDIQIHRPDGVFRTELSGRWFHDGFRGAMAEFLCAREQGRKPWNNAEENLRSLQVCFAACHAADRKKIVDVKTVTKLPPGNATA